MPAAKNQHKIDALRRRAREAMNREIDSQFAGMATDEGYARACQADWEAMRRSSEDRAKMVTRTRPRSTR